MSCPYFGKSLYLSKTTLDIYFNQLEYSPSRALTSITLEYHYILAPSVTLPKLSSYRYIFCSISLQLIVWRKICFVSVNKIFFVHFIIKLGKQFDLVLCIQICRQVFTYVTVSGNAVYEIVG